MREYYGDYANSYWCVECGFGIGKQLEETPLPTDQDRLASSLVNGSNLNSEGDVSNAEYVLVNDLMVTGG